MTTTKLATVTVALNDAAAGAGDSASSYGSAPQANTGTAMTVSAPELTGTGTSTVDLGWMGLTAVAAMLVMALRRGLR